jgi:hypothetical protein
MSGSSQCIAERGHYCTGSWADAILVSLSGTDPTRTKYDRWRLGHPRPDASTKLQLSKVLVAGMRDQSNWRSHLTVDAAGHSRQGFALG